MTARPVRPLRIQTKTGLRIIPPDDVLSAYALASGTAFRIIPHYVQRQASAFVLHFTLDDLQLVVAYLKRQVNIGKHNMTAASYSWRKLFGDHGSGDEFQTFQERLGQAQDAVAKGWKPAFMALRVVASDVAPEGFDEWVRTAYGDGAKCWLEIKSHLRSELLREYNESKK